MRIVSQKLRVDTHGNPDLVNITESVASIVEASSLKQGVATIFVIGSTAALTTFEYESGLIKDTQDMYEKLIPSTKQYLHDETWGDANGFSHLRSALQGPSLTIPFKDGKLLLGAWQQVVLAEFDTRPRERQIVVQLIGE